MVSSTLILMSASHRLGCGRCYSGAMTRNGPLITLLLFLLHKMFVLGEDRNQNLQRKKQSDNQGQSDWLEDQCFHRLLLNQLFQNTALNFAITAAPAIIYAGFHWTGGRWKWNQRKRQNNDDSILTWLSKFRQVMLYTVSTTTIYLGRTDV